MPELPDLEVFSRNLARRLSGKEVTGVTVYRTKRLNVSSEDLAHKLQGSRLIDVKRDGKEVHFLFSNDHILAVHLMLKGQFDITSDDTQIKYKSASLRFEQQGYLVISDPRGWVTLNLDPDPSPVPDALDSSFDLDYLKTRLRANASKNLKAFLVDQNVTRGIGNAYADEILWESRIAPESLCGELPEDAIGSLFRAIKTVLSEAPDQIMQINPEAINGEFREFLKIHNPDRELSPTGKLIICKKIASRKTYFSEDQKLYV